ncbi:MAG: hypothetical protein QUS07_05125 [Methanothrix sp.]|nr:hypothetical protein [Methanothrix sp.]
MPRDHSNGSEEAIALFDALSSTLEEDANSALELAKRDPSQFNLRQAHRTVFTAIEGLVSLLKDQVLALFPMNRGYYTDAEVALLREEAFYLNGKGDAITRDCFLRLEDNLKFAWKMYFREIPFEPSLCFSGPCWASFQQALRKRNCVTHPKSTNDLNVTADDLTTLEVAYSWVRCTTTRNSAKAIITMRGVLFSPILSDLPVDLSVWLTGLQINGTIPRKITPVELEELRGKGNSLQSQIETLVNKDLVVEQGEDISLTQKGATFIDWLKDRFK